MGKRGDAVRQGFPSRLRNPDEERCWLVRAGLKFREEWGSGCRWLKCGLFVCLLGMLLIQVHKADGSPGTSSQKRARPSSEGYVYIL